MTFTKRIAEIKKRMPDLEFKTASQRDVFWLIEKLEEAVKVVEFYAEDDCGTDYGFIGREFLKKLEVEW